jgi:REP element-mobilizing transposase RayT
MAYNRDIHHRQSIRLHGYDYSQNGAYFVTICVKDMMPIFGDVHNDEMQLNKYGHLVAECWQNIPQHFPNTELDSYIIMPNHLHGIIWINVGAQHAAPLPAPDTDPSQQALGIIVRSFKSAVTKSINLLRNTPGASVWQRNYYEHIIRNDGDLKAIRACIVNNPARWRHT